MPEFFRVWLYRLDPFTYIIDGMVTNELHNLPIVVSHTILFSVKLPVSHDLLVEIV